MKGINKEESFKITEILETRTRLMEKATELKNTISGGEFRNLWEIIYKFIFRSIYKTTMTKIVSEESKWRSSGHLALMVGGLGWRNENSYDSQPYTYRIAEVRKQVEAILKYGTKLVPYFKDKDKASIRNLIKWVTKNHKLIDELLQEDDPTPKVVMEIGKEITSEKGEKVGIIKIKYPTKRYGGCDYKDICISGNKDIVCSANWNSKADCPEISMNSTDLTDSYLFFVLEKEISEFFEECKKELGVFKKRIDLAVGEFKETFKAVLVLNAL